MSADLADLSTRADLATLDYALNHFGGGRNTTDQDTPDASGLYLVATDYEEGGDDGTLTARLAFRVDWDAPALVLQDDRLALVPYTPGWLDCQEWRLDIWDVYLVRTNAGRVMLAEPGYHDHRPLDTEGAAL